MLNSVAQPWDRRRDGRTAALLLLVVWTLYLLTASYGAAQINDTRSAAIAAWSVANEGSLALPDDWPAAHAYWGVEGTDGQVYSNRFPGVIAWGVPFYAISRWLGADQSPIHPFLIPFGPAAVAAATAAALGVCLMFVVLRRSQDRRIALIAAGVLGLATPVWSVASTALWPHGLTLMALAAGMLNVGSARPRPLVAGAAAAGSLLLRPHLGFAQATLAIGEARRRRWRTSAAIVIGSAIGVSVLVVYSRSLFGTFLPAAGYSTDPLIERFAFGSPLATLENLAMMLVHPNRGVFLVTPFVVLLLPFLPRAWRASPRWIRLSAVAGIVYLLIQARAIRFSGGAHFFGYRTPLEAIYLLTPLLVRAWQVGVLPSSLRRRVFTLLVAISVVMHAVVAVWFTMPPSVVAAGEESVAEAERGSDPLEDDPWVTDSSDTRRDR